MGAFTSPYDIANAGLQLLGVPRINAFTDATRQAKEASFAYDKARRSELRRFVWTFATRRAMLRPIGATATYITFPAWSSATAYNVGDVVTYSGQLFEATTAGTNHIPNTLDGVGYWEAYAGPIVTDAYSTTVKYFPGDAVTKIGTLYRLLGLASQTNTDPALGAPWIAPTGWTAGSTISFRSPASFDAPDGSNQRTAFILPANFLRFAPQDPKKAAIARLGTTAGLQFNDWEIEHGALFSFDAAGAPMIVRFVADLTIVSSFDDMFCHAVACRMALDLNEILTQRPDLAQKVAGEYNRFITEARMVSAIEMGSTEEDILAAQPQPQSQGAGGGRGGV